MLLKFKLIKISLSDNRSSECVLSYTKGAEPVNIKYTDTQFGEMFFPGKDLFDALKNTRYFLEKAGYLLLCAGSMPNVYPSRMSRQMSNGRKAYIHKQNESPRKNDVVDIFAAAEQSRVGTIEEQAQFMYKWHESFKR